MNTKSNTPDRAGTELPHHLVLEGRKRLSITGVEEVESFDENSIVLYTTKGVLWIKGSGLTIDKLSIDRGELSVEGQVDLLQYETQQQQSGGFWSRMFKAP